MAAATDRSCIHCGAPFRATAHRPDFCCAGCQFVHDLIRKNGFGQFYDLQDSSIFPVPSVVFQPRDYTWLETAAAQANGTLNLDLQGISCIGCVWLIEKLFERRAGSLSLQIDSALGQVRLRFRAGEFEPVHFARELQSFGYLLGPPGQTAKPADKSLLVRLGICAALAMNAMLFSVPTYFGMAHSFQFFGLFRTAAFVCGTLSFLIGGTYFIARSIHSLRARVLHIDFPISLGLVAAYAGSVYAWQSGADDFVYFDFVSTFTFLMLVGRWVQQAAVNQNRNRLLGMQMSVLEPKPGEQFSIAPGQVIPVRSQLNSETATLGLEWISGESEAREASRGQLVPSGAVNLSREAIALEAVESWQDSILCQLLDFQPRADRQHLGLEKFIRTYILVVLAIAAVAAGGWLFVTGDWMRSLQVLTSILVVSCPCAAGVALPMAEEFALSALRSSGVFVREASLWTRLARVKKVVFDKTGTLTTAMALRNPEVLDALSHGYKRILLTMVRDNFHPVSCCLREQLLAEAGVLPPSAAEVREVTGQGLVFQTEGHIWTLGRPESSTASQNPSADDCLFQRDGQTLASFRFGEEPRNDAREEIHALTGLGFEIQILSGDRQSKVDSIATRLGLPRENCLGQLSPVDKAHWLRLHQGHHCLMIGDGANDSLAFNESLCTGTPAIDRGLLEHKADFYFLGRGLRGIGRLLEVASAKRRATFSVLSFSIAYNIVAIALSVSARMSPLAAAILMPLSSLVTLAIVAFHFRAQARPARPV